MSIRLMSGLPGRVVQVLKDFLPAELNLIDAEESDGITTPDIVAGNFYEWDRTTVPGYPACSIRTVSSSPVEVRPESFGKRIDSRHRLDVVFHSTIGKATDAPTLVKVLERYVAGAVRVLCLTKEALQTSADNTRFVELVTWTGDATYGPEADQDSGAIVRTATLPIEVRRREAR